jgi:mannose-6-phosphate isomerase-like protein (cupin superfamily)
MLASALAGYLAGHALTPAGAVAAQGPAGVPAVTREGFPPLAPDQPARTQHWSADDLRRLHVERMSAAAAGRPQPPFQGMVGRTHVIMLTSRPYSDRPKPSNFVKVMSQWDDAEQHEGMSDIYVVVAGTGRMIVGGAIENRQYRPLGGGSPLVLPGEFVGQPVRGGETIQVKPGDLLAIPPNTAHWAQPDPGGLTYVLMKVNVGLYPWTLSR